MLFALVPKATAKWRKNMIFKRVYFDPKRENVFLYAYVPETKSEDSVLIIPGGGYASASVRDETDVIARAYAEKGISAFSLQYTAPPKGKDEPLIEAAGAFAYVKKNARSYGISPDRIFVVGFSAGGHLAGTLSTSYKKAEEMLGYPDNFLRPKGTVYAFPVVSAKCETHEGSFEMLFGKAFSEISEEEKRACSLEFNINDKVPPAFIWHTATDSVVPPYGSLRLAESYVKAGVMTELHLYPCGPHAMFLATEATSMGNEAKVDERVAGWFELSLEWMKSIS